MSEVALEFYVWLDKAAATAVLPWPGRRAQAEIARQAAGAGHGRVTLWLWRAKGLKIACAMARQGGDGGERPVRVVHGAPPQDDGLKAQMVFEGERG